MQRTPATAALEIRQWPADATGERVARPRAVVAVVRWPPRIVVIVIRELLAMRLGELPATCQSSRPTPRRRKSGCTWTPDTSPSRAAHFKDPMASPSAVIACTAGLPEWPESVQTKLTSGPSLSGTRVPSTTTGTSSRLCCEPTRAWRIRPGQQPFATLWRAMVYRI